ncbi:hypothetical protein B0J14DRAFT_684873 [Halenospora varia]|nr:hypothetical protein B0J14DRAFT_684873 [Halenospora varia]
MAHTATGVNLAVANLFDFRNDVVLVTGGATGLGEMAAQAFVQNGARVLIASRKQSELDRTVARLNALGPGRCEYVVADLKDKAGCDALCAEVRRRTDRLTVLVNNSGTTWVAAYDDFPESGWDKIMALNVKSIFYVTAGLHALLTRGATADAPNRVINIASTAGVATGDVTGGPEGGLAAVIHLSKMQASKLMPEHVTVNAICPGIFPSRMSNFDLKQVMPSLLAQQPSGRVGKADDFAGLVLFLAGRGAAHVTGNAIVIDGGSTVSGFKGKPKRQEKL